MKFSFHFMEKFKSHQSLLNKRFKKEPPLSVKKRFLEEMFESRVGYKPNIDNPQTFNEKMQYLKLYYHNSLLTKCADKVSAREYVKEKIGEKHLVPCFGVWNNPDDIDFKKLPNQFVLKINWGSGQNIIVKDKSTLNISETKKQLKIWMKPENNHYFQGFEWSYKDIKPKIIAEKYLQQKDGDLFDYKFYCFSGKIKLMLVVSDRFNEHNYNFYNCAYHKLNLQWTSHNSLKETKKPQNLKEMLNLAEILSADFPFVRVDFYSVENKIYFSELTFYPGNGMDKPNPEKWDKILGNLIVLPPKKIQNSSIITRLKQNLFWKI